MRRSYGDGSRRAYDKFLYDISAEEDRQYRKEYLKKRKNDILHKTWPEDIFFENSTSDTT